MAFMGFILIKSSRLEVIRNFFSIISKNKYRKQFLKPNTFYSNTVYKKRKTPAVSSIMCMSYISFIAKCIFEERLVSFVFRPLN